MSATVTYKGSTLTTVNNQTRVLETAGTWLEDDITPTSEDIKDDIINHIEDKYHFDTRDEIDEALEVVGSDLEVSDSNSSS